MELGIDVVIDEALRICSATAGFTIYRGSKEAERHLPRRNPRETKAWRIYQYDHSGVIRFWVGSAELLYGGIHRTCEITVCPDEVETVARWLFAGNAPESLPVQLHEVHFKIPYIWSSRAMETDTAYDKRRLRG